jgi:phosphatidylglycerophosphatase A
MAASKRVKIPAERVLNNPICFLAFGFGSGLAPKAPGTFGTLAALPLWWLASGLPLPAYLALTLLMFIGGVWLCGRCEQILGVEDHSGIVWDEFVGLFITLTAVPLSWKAVIAGFLLFRLFDVVKPWPISWLDKRLHGGFGIMLDDALAGLLAWVCLYGLLRMGLL